MLQGTSRRTFIKVLSALGAQLGSLATLTSCKTPNRGGSVLKEGEDAGPFTELSKALTGFDQLDAQLAGKYLEELKMAHGVAAQKLLDTFATMAGAADLEAQIEQKIMGDAELATVAGAAVGLWYSGGFQKLTVPEPIAVNSYKKGLVWRAMNAKPMGIPDQLEGGWAGPAS